VFPDWSALIVATYRAQVNDSEAVDALGKVEITQSKTSVVFFEAEKWREELKTAQPAEHPRRKQIRSKPRDCLLFFLYRDFHARADLAVKLNGNLVFADHFDGIGQRDLAFVDMVALRFERFGDVG
jgi:hypothetical protein